MARKPKSQSKKTAPEKLHKCNTKKRSGVCKDQAFLKAFSISGNIRRACLASGMHATRVYLLLNDKTELGERFRQQFEEAKEEAIQKLEWEARRRAERGCLRYKFTKGGDMIMIPDPSGKTQIIKRKVKENGKTVEKEIEVPIMVPYVEYEYSDTLMIFLLKSLRPEVYRERLSVDSKNDNRNLNVNGYADLGGRLPSKEQLLADLAQNVSAEDLRMLANQIDPAQLIEVNGNGHLNGNGEI